MTKPRAPAKKSVAKKTAEKKVTTQKTSPKQRPAEKETASMRLILDTTERLMREEGYGAISTRRVAKEAGLKAPLVHYYFKTTDDLFLAVFRRAVGQALDEFEDNFASQPSLKALWKSYRDPDRTALMVEFMALANHREAVREELAQYTSRYRKLRAGMISKIVDSKALKAQGGSVEGLMVVMVGLARTLIMEDGLGISEGHLEAERLIEAWLERFEVD